MSTSTLNRESTFSIDSSEPQSALLTAQTARTEESAVSGSSSEDEDAKSEDDNDSGPDSPALELESPAKSEQESEEVTSPTSSDSSGHSYSQFEQDSDQIGTPTTAGTQGEKDSESDEDGNLGEEDTLQTEEDSSLAPTTSRSDKGESDNYKQDLVEKVSTTPADTPPASALPITDKEDSEDEEQSESEGGQREEQRERERARKEAEEDAKRRMERKERRRMKKEAAAAAVTEQPAERTSSKATRDVRRIRTPRTWQHEMVRFISLYLFPVLLIIPLSLILSLNTTLLTPLYNTLPLTLHTNALYIFYALPPSIIYWHTTHRTSAKEIISARVCLSLAALSGDIVAVSGRRVGSTAGQSLGPEWGALFARAILGMGVVGGGTAFALLCFDHISPITPPVKQSDNSRNLLFILLRSAAYIFHVWLGETLWTSALSGSTSILVQSPEKTILFISLLLTALSFFLKAGSEGPPLPILVQHLLRTRLSISPPLRVQIERATTFLPAQLFPLLLLLRLPLLILALRQQIFLRPPTSRPYVTANGELRIISSDRSLTGQVVVAENLKNGYRFLRCDHSILGGRWIREVSDDSTVGGKRTDMGDSIFATFNLQEIIVLAQRADTKESLIHTLALTTDLEVVLEGDEEDISATNPNRALIIGLGAGIVATTFAKRNFNVDVVEIDPAVYNAAKNHFGLSPLITSVNLMDGSTFISQLADLQRQNQIHNNDTDTDAESVDESLRQIVPKWDYVIQDCFTGGSVPGEMFTLDFWQDLSELLVDDGVVAMNFAGILRSKASKAVLVTLLSVFPQCRAFGDGFEKEQGPNDMINMVVICTKTLSPLLTFRPPTPKDVLRSPLRSHVYSTFHPHEIQLYDVISEDDMINREFLLRRGQGGKLDSWQIGTALSTWKAMQKILTPEMWLAY